MGRRAHVRRVSSGREDEPQAAPQVQHPRRGRSPLSTRLPGRSAPGRAAAPPSRPPGFWPGSKPVDAAAIWPGARAGRWRAADHIYRAADAHHTRQAKPGQPHARDFGRARELAIVRPETAGGTPRFGRARGWRAAGDRSAGHAPKAQSVYVPGFGTLDTPRRQRGRARGSDPHLLAIPRPRTYSSSGT